MPEAKAPTLPVQYIGRHAEHKDQIYDTGDWTQGQTKLVPHLTAERMYRHVDAYIAASVEDAVESVAEKTEEKGKKDEQALDEQQKQELREHIAAMDKDAMLEYAAVHYGQKISKAKGEDKVRAELIIMVDRFGAQ